MLAGVGPRTGLDAMAKKILHFPCRKWYPGRPARSLVSILNELFQLSRHIDMQLKSGSFISNIFRYSVAL
jgi:hypothetical protein